MTPCRSFWGCSSFLDVEDLGIVASRDVATGLKSQLLVLCLKKMVITLHQLFWPTQDASSKNVPAPTSPIWNRFNGFHMAAVLLFIEDVQQL